MKKLLIPLLLAAIGLTGGVAAGYLTGGSPDGATVAPAVDAPLADPSQIEFVRLNNQFVVPVLEGGRIVSLVATSLSLEVATGLSDFVYAKEPKLQDAFLQVLFDHANSGGFRGSFTDSSNLILLRKALLEQAQQVLGNDVSDVLITEIARQDS